MPECHICCGEHNDELHRVSKEVRRWNYEQTMMGTEPVVKKQPLNPGVVAARKLRTGIEVWPASVPGVGWVDLAR